MKKLMFLATLVAMAGCGTMYSWRSNVPQGMRTVSVPTFRNATELTEIGSVVARQTLREFQREGTFKLASSDEAAIEIQGEVKSVSSGNVAYDRRSFSRMTTGDLKIEAVVSIVDKRNGKVLVDNWTAKASVPITYLQDINTAERDAAGRLADLLSREIVDKTLNLKW